MSTAFSRIISYGRPEDKQETERLERCFQEQEERDELRRQQRQAEAAASQQTQKQ